MRDLNLQTIRRRLELGRLLAGSLLETAIKAYGVGAVVAVALSDAETAGGNSVERPDRRDADGVAAVCVREGVCAGHCGVRLLCGSQRGLGVALCMRVLYAVWVSQAGGLVATSLIPRSPLVSLVSTEVRF